MAPKITKIANILKFYIFESFWKFCCFSQIICFPKNSAPNDSSIFLKVHGFRYLENLKHPSWGSSRSDLTGDRVFDESRQYAIKSSLRGLSGKLLTHTPTSLVTTLLYTLKLFIACKNTHPLYSLNFQFLILEYYYYSNIISKSHATARTLFYHWQYTVWKYLERKYRETFLRV